MTVDELPEYLKQHGPKIGNSYETNLSNRSRKAGGNPEATVRGAQVRRV